MEDQPQDPTQPAPAQLNLFAHEQSADAETYPPIEALDAYCVRCRKTVEAGDAEPVWTSKGTPGTRGICPECGTTIFRLGRTAAHDGLNRPAAVRVGSNVKVALEGRRKRMLPATYINYDAADTEFAEKLAEDLEKSGVHTWIEVGETAHVPQAEVSWAGGVHPALKDSARMVVILSARSHDAAKLTNDWRFFRAQKKPIVVVLLDEVSVPDALRRSPRLDFRKEHKEYKAAFRQLIAALSD